MESLSPFGSSWKAQTLWGVCLRHSFRFFLLHSAWKERNFNGVVVHFLRTRAPVRVSRQRTSDSTLSSRTLWLLRPRRSRRGHALAFYRSTHTHEHTRFCKGQTSIFCAPSCAHEKARTRLACSHGKSPSVYELGVCRGIEEMVLADGIVLCDQREATETVPHHTT